MTGPEEPPLRHRSGRVLMLGGFVLAVAAAAALALGAQDASLLRLGIVAALWAALLGAFAAVRMRREIESGADHAEQLRALYRLELDREIAARREHELTVERELREQAEQRARGDIATLRGELRTLQEALQHLLGGDMLVERVALRAESTRLLPLAEPSRNIDDAHGRVSAAEPVGRPPHSLTMAPAPPSARAASGSGRDLWDVEQRPDSPYRRSEPAAPPRPVPPRPATAPRRPPPPRSAAPRRATPEPPPHRETTFRPAPRPDDSSELGIFAGTVAELSGKPSPERPWSAGAPAAPAPDPGAPAYRQTEARSRTSRHREEPEPAGPPAPPAPRATPPAAAASPASAMPSTAGRVGSFRDQNPLDGAAHHGGESGRGAAGRHSRTSTPRYHTAATPPAQAPASSGSSGSREPANRGTGYGESGYGESGYGESGYRTYRTEERSSSPQGGRRRQAPDRTSAKPTGAREGSRTVDELLAAYGEAPVPRRRHRRAGD